MNDCDGETTDLYCYPDSPYNYDHPSTCDALSSIDIQPIQLENICDEIQGIEITTDPSNDVGDLNWTIETGETGSLVDDLKQFVESQSNQNLIIPNNKLIGYVEYTVIAKYKFAISKQKFNIEGLFEFDIAPTLPTTNLAIDLPVEIVMDIGTPCI